ncbi:glycosyltransferase family 2 protein [Propionispira raffinosivorans]|uniref:glycosyltransferase family 2 protein n=1 Tax=Propionispira raffinosivorans TaxID=86959 RepID=UPI0003736B49|nr:glycosyltransferase family 2 protein [Propionispira raffinosivorans]
MADFSRKNNIVAIVVVYNPELDLVTANIDNIKKQVDKVFVVNNSKRNYSFIDVEIINNGDNLGIAKALNIGLTFAIKNKFKYAVLLDQDSKIDKNMVEFLIAGHKVAGNVAMTVPKVIYNGISSTYPNKMSNTHFVNFAITSGSCINLEIISNIGFMDESFFIDSVDFDYCFKIKMSGYHIIQINNALLYQQLGNLKEYKILCFKFYPINYVPIRQYYIVRNRLYLAIRYFKHNPMFFLKSILRILYNMFLIIIFEENKVQKLIYIQKGIIDCLLNRMGKYS